jgi:hypothetical protein
VYFSLWRALCTLKVCVKPRDCYLPVWDMATHRKQDTVLIHLQPPPVGSISPLSTGHRARGLPIDPLHLKTVLVSKVKIRPMCPITLEACWPQSQFIIHICVSLLRSTPQGLSHIAQVVTHNFHTFHRVHFTVTVHHNEKQQPLRFPALWWLHSTHVYMCATHRHHDVPAVTSCSLSR